MADLGECAQGHVAAPMPAQKLSAECVAVGPVLTSTPMVPVVYFVSVTLIVVPAAVSVKVWPTTLPTRWNGVPTAGSGPGWT